MSTQTKKILIADDERPIASALELKLSSLGFQVKVVSNGEEALTALENEKFDLAVLDLIMPKVTGFEVLKNLQEKNVKMPVIVASNLSQEEDRKKAMKLGAVDYVIKSDIPISEIAEKVKKNIKRKE